MQNDVKREKPSLQEFTKLMEAFRHRMPRGGYRSGPEYISALMDKGLSVENAQGKDLFIVMLGAVGMLALAQCEDTEGYFTMIKTELDMRSLYDKDYESMVDFLGTVKQRMKLADSSKAELCKSVTTDILKKHFKEDASGRSALAVRDEQPADAAPADTPAQGETDSLG